MARPILVAGVGNIFLGDDGFGVEVARRMAAEPIPPGVTVTDFGIRGIHLAYELLEDRYAAVILVDALARGVTPGTVSVIEPDEATPAPAGGADPHAMSPDAVLRLLRALGGRCPRLLVVGCEPATLEEEMGLSPAVERAVEEAIAVVHALIRREAGSGQSPAAETGGAA